jgi:ATP/ADP translocase
VSAIFRYLRGLLPLQRDERRLALFLYALLTLMVLADWVGKVGSDSLFVKRFGVQWLPVMFVATPIAMLATSALLFAVIDRLRRRTLLLGYVAAVMVLSVAIQAALPGGGLIYPLAYVFAHGVKETIYLVFWVYAGNLYDTEQAKRLFPIFAGAVLVGKILGGVLAAGLSEVIHAENMIGAQAVGFAAALVLLILYRDLPEGRGRQREASRGKGLAATLRDSVEGLRAVTADRLLRTLGVNVFFWYLLMQMGTYLYYVGLDVSSQLATARKSEDSFVQIYSSVYTSASVLGLAVQLFLTAPLLKRFGIGTVLHIFPVWYLFAYGAALWSFNLVTSVAIQLGERVWIPAIHRPTTELVYSQVSSRIRPRARAFLSGGVNALGNVTAAAVLISSTWLGFSERILALSTALSALFIANSWSLQRALGQRIAENLRSEDAELRLNAVQMLAGEGTSVPTAALREVLRSPAADVEHGVRLALTRRGALAVAADATLE